MNAALKLNEHITFGKVGSIKEMDPYGFDLSEQGISWTVEQAAGFSVMFGATPGDSGLRFHAAVTPFIHAGHAEQQQFFVFMNGIFVGFRTLTVAAKIDFALPRNVFSPRGIRVEFVIPTAVSPKALGISQDIRKLGIAISEISFGAQK